MRRGIRQEKGKKAIRPGKEVNKTNRRRKNRK